MKQKKYVLIPDFPYFINFLEAIFVRIMLIPNFIIILNFITMTYNLLFTI